MHRLSAERAIGAGLAIGAIVLVAVLVLGVGSALLAGGPSATPSASPVAQAAPTDTQATPSQPTATLSDSPSISQSPTSTHSAAPTASLALPTMLAAIGDSYSQAWSVAPGYKRDHPAFSWVVGTAKGDGVFSLRERFESLGDKLKVVDAATSGMKMSDSARQATGVVTAANGLPAGSTVYVTFELGTNDLCDDPMTAPADFEAQLRASVSILRAGLPAGSRILMLSVPDFAHFYAITQADPTAKATLKLRANSSTCPPFLGSNTSNSMQQAKDTLAAYNAVLYRVCDEIEATDGPSGTLHCRRNEAALSERDFTIKDLSRVDYFHPSILGQASMAAAAWKVGYWSNLPLPKGAVAFVPGGAGDVGGTALAGILAVAPFVPMRRLRQVRRRATVPAGWRGPRPRFPAPSSPLAAPSRPA
jgi:lysophospholipase L1-like esterase